MLTVVTVHPILAAPLGHTVGSYIPTTRTQPRRYHCCGEYLSIGGADCDHSVHPVLAASLGHTAGSYIPTTRTQPGRYHCCGEYLSIGDADCAHCGHTVLAAHWVTQLALISQPPGHNQGDTIVVVSI